MKKFLIANLAGGTGKTTTAHSLATAIAEYGKRALVIDADPGAALTFLCGVENPRYCTRELFDGAEKLENIIVKTADRFSLVPSASRLFHTDFKGIARLETQLNQFDVLLIDSPTGPSALTAPLIELADQIISPIDASMLSIRGALNLRDFQSKSEKKPEIRLLEIKSVAWDEELRKAVLEDFKFFDVSIRRDESVLAAQLSTRSVLSEYPHSNIASDFRELGYSLLEEIGLL
ncbi:MAG: ParA family protein [Actinomycetota bacterium]